MHDLKTIRQDPAAFKAALRARGDHDAQVDEICEVDAELRRQQAVRDDKKAAQNKLSKQIGQLHQAGQKEEAGRVKGEADALKAEVEALEGPLKELRERRHELLQWLPNLPHPEAPVGPDESANVVVEEARGLRRFDFEPKEQRALAGDGSELGLFSLETAARLAGSGFTLMRGQGARLMRSLISLMLDLHTQEHGYTEIWPPSLATSDVLYGTGQIPKLADDMYRLDARDDLYLIPTSEVQLVNMHRGEVLSEAELPARYCAYTHCFRREAGAAGTGTAGLIRLHQFDKVEMVQLTTPEASEEALEAMIAHASRVLELLELPFRRVALATGDLSFASQRTYDLELYAPGSDRWLEVSSISNCTDFQARRADIRYKPAEGGPPRFVHTLNGSGVALPRLVVAILENYQRGDGRIDVPEALQDRMGCKVLEGA